MLFVYVLGLQINYSPVNWERCYVIERSLWAYSSSESSFTEETHLQSIWFNSSWQEWEEVEGAGVGWHCTQRWGGGWWQIGTKIKEDWASGSPPGRWSTASMSRRKAVTEAEEMPCPSWPVVTETSFFFPTNWLSLTDIFFSAVCLRQPASIVAFKDIGKNCFLSSFIWATKILYTYSDAGKCLV